jgi:hypothetical protein
MARDGCGLKIPFGSNRVRVRPPPPASTQLARELFRASVRPKGELEAVRHAFVHRRRDRDDNRDLEAPSRLQFCDHLTNTVGDPHSRRE